MTEKGVTFYCPRDTWKTTSSCRFSPETMKLIDRIFHVMAKVWLTTRMIFDLIRCIEENCQNGPLEDARFLFCQNEGKDIDWRRLVGRQDPRKQVSKVS